MFAEEAADILGDDTGAELGEPLLGLGPGAP